MIIDRLWKLQPHARFFFVATRTVTKQFKQYAFDNDEQLVTKLRKFIQEHQDKDVWWVPHGFMRRDRQKEHAASSRLLWADLDAVDPRTLNGPLKPSIAIETSPGRYHGVWVCDRDTDEHLNKRLSYFIGADRGGWDLTQLLRVPGTKNFKYMTMPVVRTLWTDGPQINVDELLKVLPDVERDVDGGDGGGDVLEASEIYKKYGKKINSALRQRLMQSTIPRGADRSEMLYKLGAQLLEAGLDIDEAVCLLKGSQWNKFKGRANEIDLLRLGITKKVDQKLGGARRSLPLTKRGANSSTAEIDDSAAQQLEYKFLVKSMADVTEENIDWIWWPYLAKGELSILEGDPDLGKSYVAQMISKAICDGSGLPAVRSGEKSVQGKVAYFDIENSPGSVTKKRLVYNGIKHPENYFQDDQPFTIDNEEAMEKVHNALSEHKPMLVVFDTLNTYIGANTDTYRANEAQSAMSQFKQIAKRYGCAVLVLRHLTKSSKGPALYRGQGSIAFSGLARVVITAGRVPEDRTEIPDCRALAITKFNLGKKPEALCYTIESDPSQGQDGSVFSWHDFVQMSADELLDDENKSSEREARNDKKNDLEECKLWLHDMLREGPREAKDIIADAEKRSWSEKLLRRAHKELGNHRKRVGFGNGGAWMWTLTAD